MMIHLHLRGATARHYGTALLAAWPAGLLLYARLGYRVAFSPYLLSGALVLALVPWIARALARATYHAAFDDVALHVRGEALPFRAITGARVIRKPRRHTLYLERGETLTIELVLWDAFAGRLEPRAALERRLAQHGHPLSPPA